MELDSSPTIITSPSDLTEDASVQEPWGSFAMESEVESNSYQPLKESKPVATELEEIQEPSLSGPTLESLSLGVPAQLVSDQNVTPPAFDKVPAEVIPTPVGNSEKVANQTNTDAKESATIYTPPSKTIQIVSDEEQDEPKEEDVATGDEKPQMAEGSPDEYLAWKKPDLTLVVTGNQHGYIEPCGCTGLDRQKGGVARRFTFIQQLKDRGWNVAPIDAGNQVRRYGPQSEIKLQQTVEAMRQMEYVTVGVGPDDARLGVGPMLAVAAGAEDSLFCSANVVLFDDSMMPKIRVVDSGGIKVGVTSLLDPESIDGPIAEEIKVGDVKSAAKTALDQMNAAKVKVRVAMFFGEEDKAKSLFQEVQGYDLVVVSGGYGEPTYKPMTIDGSDTQIILTGNKGMYAGLVGLYADAEMKYARVPLTHELEDAPAMRRLMADYQDQLKQIGLKGMGLLPPIPHSSGDQFVGSEACGKCHTKAMEVWENSMHAEATAHLVEPPAERSDVARHFDPECLSCHVTGWNPQEFYPYESGYLSLEQSAHLTGNGCENCHGPGAAHSAAEVEGSAVDKAKRDALRLAIRLPLEKAREKCMECHDMDNSPDFHEKDAFEDVYWPQVEHSGKD
jgi:Cytochrome c554 and c-prime